MEWLLFLSVLAVAPLLFLRHRRRFWKWTAAAALVSAGLTLLAAKLFADKTSLNAQAQETFLGSLPHQGRPDGYVASDKCQACHPSQYDSWHRTFHRTMTQVASREAVVGNFDNVTLELLGKSYHLERSGDEFFVEMEDPDWKNDQAKRGSASIALASTPPRLKKRVGLLTGSHHMQVYWTLSHFGNLQRIFPFAWLIEDQRWVPFHQTFLRDPAIPPVKHAWNDNCINCHATGGQPRPDPVTHLPDSRVGELGIACEACHGPAEQHVQANQNPIRRYEFHQAKKADPTIVNPERLPAKLSSQVCGSCHGIKWISDRQDWSQNGFRYRPGQELSGTTPIIRPRHLETQPWLAEPLKKNPTFLKDHYWSDGMARVSGRDYSGMLESACYQRGELTCLSCHSVHHSDPNNQIKTGMNGNQACLQCHESYRTKLQEHTHHLAESPGSECYNCHMPYTTYGLMKAIRSHWIDSPTVKSSVETGRPNACNLCHLNQSLAWTAKNLGLWYGQPGIELGEDGKNISAAVLWALKGNAGQRALIAWSMGWESARKASEQKWLAPYLAQLLDDPYSTVRYIAQRSLKRLPDYQSFTYDFVGSAEERTRSRQRALEIWQERDAKSFDRVEPGVLIGTNGSLDLATIARLLQQRDHSSMDLQE